MHYKLALLIIIIALLTLLVYIKRSSRQLWNANTSINSRMFTLRSIAIIIIILLFLFFSLFR